VDRCCVYVVWIAVELNYFQILSRFFYYVTKCSTEKKDDIQQNIVLVCETQA
jgi:hypothetical protein